MEPASTLEVVAQIAVLFCLAVWGFFEFVALLSRNDD